MQTHIRVGKHTYRHTRTHVCMHAPSEIHTHSSLSHIHVCMPTHIINNTHDHTNIHTKKKTKTIWKGDKSIMIIEGREIWILQQAINKKEHAHLQIVWKYLVQNLEAPIMVKKRDFP